jgi:methyl-accepting chemotaxis protein
VEAARAGDAGKGFAVVAVEVRTLAQRCAEAATSVNKLISASKDQVGRGSSLVNETGTVLTSIAEQIVGLRAAIDEMASSAATQSTRFGQINETVVEMTRITEQSAAMIEESFATTQSLAQESELARRALAKFNTHSDTNHNAPARAAA